MKNEVPAVLDTAIFDARNLCFHRWRVRGPVGREVIGNREEREECQELMRKPVGNQNLIGQEVEVGFIQSLGS